MSLLDFICWQVEVGELNRWRLDWIPVWLTKVLGCIQPLFFKEKLQVINKKTKQALKCLVKLASAECMYQSELEFVVSKLTY